MLAVRAFEAGDEDAFLSLYRDCLDHYNVGPPRPEIERAILEEFATEYGMSADLAWRGAEPVGFACWIRVFPAGDGFAFFLKELYITAEVRGTGAGGALMRQLADHAAAMGAVRMNWGSFQPDALDFYDRIGAAREDYTTYSVRPDTYATLARRPRE